MDINLLLLGHYYPNDPYPSLEVLSQLSFQLIDLIVIGNDFNYETQESFLLLLYLASLARQ